MNPHSILSNAFAKSRNAMMPSNWCFFDKYITSSTVLMLCPKKRPNYDASLLMITCIAGVKSTNRIIRTQANHGDIERKTIICMTFQSNFFPNIVIFVGFKSNN